MRHQIFPPSVFISAAQANKSDDLRYAMSPFSLCLSLFLHAKNLVVHPPKTGKRRSIFTRRGDIIGLSNAPLTDADSENQRISDDLEITCVHAACCEQNVPKFRLDGVWL